MTLQLAVSHWQLTNKATTHCTTSATSVHSGPTTPTTWTSRERPLTSASQCTASASASSSCASHRGLRLLTRSGKQRCGHQLLNQYVTATLTVYAGAFTRLAIGTFFGRKWQGRRAVYSRNITMLVSLYIGIFVGASLSFLVVDECIKEGKQK